MPDRALLLIDVQNDFCPGGALAVPEGDRIVPVLNRYIEKFEARGLPVFASRDWHPQETSHFVSGGGIWPPHCVRDTRGAAFHAELALPEGAQVVSKGMAADSDAYSAFQGEVGAGEALADALRAKGVRQLYVGGLATDYCVRASVLDALREGFDVVVLEDAVKGIDLNPGDITRAVEEMEESGARTATLATVEQELAAPPERRAAD